MSDWKLFINGEEISAAREPVITIEREPVAVSLGSFTQYLPSKPSLTVDLKWPDVEWLDSEKAQVLYLYAPANLPWYRAWWIRLRRKPWPDELIFSGLVGVSSFSLVHDGDMTAQFRSEDVTIYAPADPRWRSRAHVLWNRIRTRRMKNGPRQQEPREEDLWEEDDSDDGDTPPEG